MAKEFLGSWIQAWLDASVANKPKEYPRTSEMNKVGVKIDRTQACFANKGYRQGRMGEFMRGKSGK